jgi:hypothetical protein
MWVTDAGYWNRSICDGCCDNWHICNDCGELIHDDDTYYVGDNWDDPYCEDCIDRHRGNDSEYIHDYGYKPYPEIRRRKGESENELTFGVELEVDNGDCAGDTAEDVTDAAEGRVYCKHDGSLDSGFEIVSHPGTLAHHMYEMHWRDISRICKKAGFKSHDTTTCGLHIHVGRKQLGDGHEDQGRVIANVITLVASLRESIITFTRRSDYALSRWAALPTFDTHISESRTAELIRCDALQTRYNGRYQAVNLQNSGTIEFRIFRGTLNRNTLIASIQLVSNLCKYAMTHTLEECTTATFAGIVGVAPYRELVDYCADRSICSGVAIPA